MSVVVACTRMHYVSSVAPPVPHLPPMAENKRKPHVHRENTYTTVSIHLLLYHGLLFVQEMDLLCS